LLAVIRKYESLASESATLHAYLREISNFPSLTPEDERQLGRHFQQHGDEEALSRLVQANLRAVVHYAKRFRHLGVPLLDLIHEGNLGLIEAARRYDPAGSADFQAAAQWWIRQAIMQLFAETGSSVETSTTGLLAATAQSRQIEAIRVAIDFALSAAAGQDVHEPATSDVEDFAAHLREQGHKRNRRKKRRNRPIAPAALDSTTPMGARALRAFLN
jgi:RNA polymerase sigma factor (sigma-70 family)